MRFKLLVLPALCVFVVSCSQESQQSQAALANGEQVQQYRQQVDLLRQKVQSIKDSNDIKRLQRIFGYYFDEGMWDDMANLVSDDATLEYARDGVYQGKQRIREYFYALGGGKAGLSEGQLNEHFQLMPVITLSEDGSTAKGRWRDISLQGQYGEFAWWGEGPYENEYVKENGVWKISKIVWYQTVVANYETGWAKHEDANHGIYVSNELPPDAPPTFDHGYWPKTFLPPFHFDNPVGKYTPPAEESELAPGQGEQR